VLPGLIDGEQRNVSKYDEALKSSDVPVSVVSLLDRQRHGLAQKIMHMQALAATRERVS
jgi:hypothetical protein